MSIEKTQIDLIADGKKFTTDASKIELRINGITVYDFEVSSVGSKKVKGSATDCETITVSFLIRIMKAMFGHPDRYKIINLLRDSPETFTQIQRCVDSSPATIDFHLKKLSNEMVVWKNSKKEYSLTIIGEVLLDYFDDLIKKVKSFDAPFNKG